MINPSAVVSKKTKTRLDVLAFWLPLLRNRAHATYTFHFNQLIRQHFHSLFRAGGSTQRVPFARAPRSRGQKKSGGMHTNEYGNTVRAERTITPYPSPKDVGEMLARSTNPEDPPSSLVGNIVNGESHFALRVEFILFPKCCVKLKKAVTRGQEVDSCNFLDSIVRRQVFENWQFFSQFHTVGPQE